MAPSKNRDGTSSTLNSKVYERIRADVLTCQVPPGSFISEAALVQKYKFGKAGIRNALARLIQEGMVVNRGRKGHIVRPLTMRELREIFQMRLLIEPPAARIAAPIITDEAIKKLIILSKQSRTVPNDDPKSVVARLAATRSFHVAIAEATGNELLIRFMSRVHDNMLRVSYLTVATSPESDTRQEYQSIIDAFTAHDPDRAAEVVKLHVENSERNVMRAITDLPGILNVNLGDLGLRLAPK